MDAKLGDGYVVKKDCYIFHGTEDAICSSLLEEVSKIKRHRKYNIQMIVLTGSRERAFHLFSEICNYVRSTQILCHVSVGSIKYERDLKALHLGVDILVVTPGRLPRLYKGNENCFTSIHSVFIDQAELVFYRSVLHQVCVYCVL
ncbi:uncharacterized protein [Blastocystis hominis]|uniref:DEAD/DEAH-box helicase domain-containing protein n=1 Tax=Blastocystis hominis TaxID=12968 RepID=D8M5X4_BLAHO|nr:uncharacterized protein [Blastocystis hominis]CBK23573.2 unnamed protein product [Blastocystis hominis]|eukprot:XP_012897621.1 uncharacterized protein [Blastocystis hominis]